jgi:hypothetical protein
MEIIFWIIGFIIFFVLILPFLTAFIGDNKQKTKLDKTKEALQGVKENYKATVDTVSTGIESLNEGVKALRVHTSTWEEKAKQAVAKEKEQRYQNLKLEFEKSKSKSRFSEGLDNLDKEREKQKNEFLRSLKKINEEAEKRKRREEVERIVAEAKESLVKHQESLAQNIKHTNERKQKNNIVEVELSKLPPALIEFIYIRYYLTGLKTLPQLKCIYDSWAKTPYVETELNEEVWGKIIEQMSFNEMKCKKIDALYHFTHKDNLPSILSKGLLTKKNLEDQNITYKYNDEKRLDGVKDSLSLSFSHPNWKMFGKYRNLIGQNNFVVLKISPELLSGNSDLHHKHLDDLDYLDKAIFCKKNAANQIESKKSILERKSHKVFLDIFESTIDIELRTYPYLNESEILYQGNIPKDFVKEIHVIEEDINLAWVNDLGFKLSINKTVFEKR